MNLAMIDRAKFQTLNRITVIPLLFTDLLVNSVELDLIRRSILREIENVNFFAESFQQGRNSAHVILMPMRQDHRMDSLEFQLVQQHDQFSCRFAAVENHQFPIVEIYDLASTLPNIDEVDGSTLSGRSQLQAPTSLASMLLKEDWNKRPPALPL